MGNAEYGLAIKKKTNRSCNKLEQANQYTTGLGRFNSRFGQNDGSTLPDPLNANALAIEAAAQCFRPHTRLRWSLEKSTKDPHETALFTSHHDPSCYKSCICDPRHEALKYGSFHK